MDQTRGALPRSTQFETSAGVPEPAIGDWTFMPTNTSTGKALRVVLGHYDGSKGCEIHIQAPLPTGPDCRKEAVRQLRWLADQIEAVQ